MEVQQIKEGDIVKLNSGGPEMTYSYKSSSGWFVCKWFINNELKSGEFSGEDLQKIR